MLGLFTISVSYASSFTAKIEFNESKTPGWNYKCYGSLVQLVILVICSLANAVLLYFYKDKEDAHTFLRGVFIVITSKQAR